MQFLIRLLVGCVIAVGLLGGPFGAQAKPPTDDRHGIVTLDLRPDAGETPTHLCVVAEAKSPRARDRLWDLLEREPLRVDTAGSTTATHWRVLPKAWAGDRGSADHQQCSTDPVGDCRPRVELPASLTSSNDFYAACTVDSLADGGPTDDPRPLFILIEFLGGSPPQIEWVRLAGSIATIGVAANLNHGVISARSLGGAYLPHKRSERGVPDAPGEAGGLSSRTVSLELQLTPRCQMVELTLPRTTLEPEDRARLRVRAHGVELDVKKCVSLVAGTEVLQVRLPQAPLGVGNIDVELRGVEGRPAAQFGGRYEGRWHHSPFALRFKQVSFSWRRPACIYPSGQCPTATLATGTVCAATPTETGCDYRCPGVVDDAANDLQLPLALTFEKTQPTQRWTDTLARTGQTLSSYVPSDEIYLSANVSHWTTDVPDNHIGGVEIYGEDGEAREYGIGPLPASEEDDAATPPEERTPGPKPPRDFRLKVPGASCEPVRYRPIGDRRYDESVAQISDGKLRFGKPEKAARLVGFNVTLAAGGGPAFTTYRGVGANDGGQSPVYFSGLGMFAVEVRPRKPKVSRLAVEVRFGGTLGRYATTLEVPQEQVEADPAPADPSPQQTTDTSTTAVGWARLLIEPGLVVSAHRQVAVGMGFGVGMALPFRNNKNLVAERLRFIYSPNVDLRFPVRRWLKLVLQARGILHEQAFAQGQPSRPAPSKEDWSGSFLLLVGLQASF